MTNLQKPKRKWKKKTRGVPTARIEVNITSEEHFSRIVQTLKARVGTKGIDWTFPGKIRRYLPRATQKVPLKRTVHIFIKDPPENLEFLFKLME